MEKFNSLFERNFDSMEALADEISEQLQSQVTIEDSHHNVLGYSSHQFESDSARILTIISRRVPNSVIAGLRKHGIMKLLESTSRPIWISAIKEIGLGDRLAICVKHQNNILGYIWVVNYGGFVKEEAEQIVIKAAGIAKRLLLKRHSWSGKRERMIDEFFWKLLTGDYENETNITKEADFLNVQLPSSYHIIVFELSHTIDDRTLARYQKQMMSIRQVNLIFLSASNNQMIGLVAGTKSGSEKGALRAFVAAVDRNLKELGESCLIATGCSMAFRSYQQTNMAYQEALSILSIKKLIPFHTRDLMVIGDMGFFIYVPLVMEYKKKIGYRNPMLERLREYDSENKSDLVKTLAVYLTFHCNLKKSAAVLHIHVNTLTYRLHRIEEITEGSLKEMNNLATLYMDLLTEDTEAINGWLSIARGG